MLRNKDLISDRPATMKDVTEVAQAVIESFGEVMMNVLDVALTAAVDDPSKREAMHIALMTALPTARDAYRADESLFSAVLANELFRALKEIRLGDTEFSG